MLGGFAPGASAADKTLLVTYAARVCPTYPDISANRARNDIQESLRDLGPNTTYQGGEPIDPKIEDAVQPNCQPLPNWTFTLGTGYKTRAVSGPWGSLSIVTNPFPTSVVTQDSVPLLDTQGVPTGSSIAGAVTVALTAEQAKIAAKPNSLWVQGGTPTDPILNVPYPDQYGFGALRCAIDNLNGDNVEWVSVPAGLTHVFCYAFYVQPPPTSGEIIVRKETSGAGDKAQPFAFGGNLSFNDGGHFSLSASDAKPAQRTFIRAETRPGDPLWNVSEAVPPGWRLAGLTCTSKSGASESTVDLAAATASISLAAGDFVTCTYKDAVRPPPSGLVLTELTRGGVGAFDFDLTGPGDTTREARATTTEAGIAVEATPGFGELEAGDYTIRERLPSSDRGEWKLTGISCDGDAVPTENPLHITLAAGKGRVCAYENRFVPDGSLVIRKVTIGGTARTGFTVGPEGTAPPVYRQSVTTSEAGVPTTAAGDSTSHLSLGRYSIVETTPKGGNGTWELVSVDCDGVPTAFSAGRAEVALTEARPDAVCTFYDKFTSSPTPPTPPTPPNPPPTPPNPPLPVEPISDLRVVKRVTPRSIVLGATATYRIRVTNRGPDPATGVRIDERLFRALVPFVSLRTSKGRCFRSSPSYCDLGTLAAGETQTVTAVVRPTRIGVVDNRVAAGTASFDPNPRGATSGTRLRVRRPPSPPFTG